MEHIGSLRWTFISVILALLVGIVFSSQIREPVQSLIMGPTTVPYPTFAPWTATVEPTATTTHTPLPTLTATHVGVDKESVVLRVKKALKLVTAESVISVDVRFSDKKSMILTEGKYTVIAGIDLEELTANDIEVVPYGNENSVMITLPPTKFLYDPAEVKGTSKVLEIIALSWDQGLSDYFFGKNLEIPERNEINSAQQDQALRRACESGLLEFAADHARYELRKFLELTDSKQNLNNYVIVTSAGTCEK
jgi:hypothetical protein